MLSSNLKLLFKLFNKALFSLFLIVGSLVFFFFIEENEQEEALEKSKGNSLGFKDCQLLLGFNHNTPDNTLPIFWYDEKNYNWYPIFKRYKKNNF